MDAVCVGTCTSGVYCIKLFDAIIKHAFVASERVVGKNFGFVLSHPSDPTRLSALEIEKYPRETVGRKGHADET